MDNLEGGFDMRLKTSFNCLVAGAAGTGKTTFVRNLLSIGPQIFTTPTLDAEIVSHDVAHHQSG